MCGEMQSSEKAGREQAKPEAEDEDGSRQK